MLGNVERGSQMFIYLVGHGHDGKEGRHDHTPPSILTTDDKNIYRELLWTILDTQLFCFN